MQKKNVIPKEMWFLLIIVLNGFGEYMEKFLFSCFG